MKLEKDQLNDKIILTLSEIEYTMVINALRAASCDDTRRGHAYSYFYDVDREEMLDLFNKIDRTERETN